MISIIGNLLLFLTMAFACLSLRVTKNKVQICVFYLCSFMPFMSFLTLLLGFITCDFSIRNVFLNSSSKLPIIYKIAASWSNHEGSFLLWLGLMGLVGFAYTSLLVRKCRNREDGMVIIAMTLVIMTLTYLLFTWCILKTSNPFETFSFVADEGLGLNPMLQDVALSIHPPLLYLGNLCYLAPFAGALTVLVEPKSLELILPIIKLFSSIALSLLTIGIALGSWWAYRELGWGGYWFFDPVENISLLPWLSGITLHHFILIYQKNKKFLKSILVLSITSFLLVIYGTFMVRSGIIHSVHSFAFSPERGVTIFVSCSTLTLFVLVTWSSMEKDLLTISPDIHYKKEPIVLLGNIFWLIALVALIIAIIYPVYCYMMFDQEIAIDPEYFYNIFIPLFIPILLLAGLAPKLNISISRIILTLFIISISLLYLSTKADIGLISGAIFVASLFMIIQMIIYAFFESNYLRRGLSYGKTALLLAHLGFGLLALSITLNCLLAKEISFIGKIGDKVQQDGFTVTLENIKFSEQENYFRQIVIVKVEDENNNIILLKPENRLYKIENRLSQEVDIFSFIFYDLYAVLSQIDQEIIHAKIHYQPFISFIWLSVLIMTLGFIVKLLKK